MAPYRRSLTAAPYSPVSHRRGGIAMLHSHAGPSRRSKPQDLAWRSGNGLRPGDAVLPVRRRHSPVRAGLRACRPRMNVPATGIIRAGSGSLMRRGGEGTTQGPAASRRDCRQASPMGAIGISRRGERAVFRVDLVAHPSGMHRCRDAESRATGGSGAANQGVERTGGGRKGRMAPDRRGESASCVAFGAVRSRWLRFGITHDSSHYRLLSCANPPIPASPAVHRIPEPIAVAP